MHFDLFTIYTHSYVVQVDHFAERLLWIATIATSFTIAGFLMLATLNETSDNPIATSVNIVPIQVDVALNFERTEFFCFLNVYCIVRK